VGTIIQRRIKNDNEEATFWYLRNYILFCAF
jgi:hypothetical protein